jgi:AraC family transcriptional regulator
MDYLLHILRAIRFIEKNLCEDIKTAEVAQETAFSKYHFHRIFLAVTGNTIADYIRRRRLTNAAFELVESDKKIIDIALDHCFETPESFSRAFRRMYGVTPKKYRDQKPFTVYLHQTKIDENFIRHLKGGITIEPEIIQMDKFKIVGMKYYGENKNNEINRLWDQFNASVNEIKNSPCGDVRYGICYPIENFAEKGEFEYIAAIEVSNLNDIPEGMVGRTIQGQVYAVFTHKGSPEKIAETYKYIYGTWHPKSGYSLLKAPDFEYYDERFNPDIEEDSEFDVYIPIKKLTV